MLTGVNPQGYYGHCSAVSVAIVPRRALGWPRQAESVDDGHHLLARRVM